MKILVIEDQQDILQNIVDYLEIKGYLVDCAYDGLGGLHLALTQTFDLMILDLMLPGMDGLTLCRRLQESNVQLPIIMLTAKDSLNDKLTGFDAGAADYLVKPFALSELHARIEAVLCRNRPPGGLPLQVGDLRFDIQKLQVSRADQPLKISPIGLKLLEKLMKQSPAVVRREEFHRLLWGEDMPDSDSLRSHVHQLRQAIDKPFTTQLLHNVHGVGYCLKVEDDAL
jgi:DNA-binding response OmpR family regulator